MVSNTTTGKGDVIGHAKIARLPFEPASCMIESGKIMLVRECKSSQSKTSFGSSDKSSQQRKGFW